MGDCAHRRECPRYGAGGPAGPDASHGSSPRVLVIDDDPNLREIVSAVLASFEYDCQTGEDGQSGLARFDEGAGTSPCPRCVAGRSSRRSAQRVPTIPVVLFTGLSTPAVLRQALECRVQVIVKPFQVQTLKAAVVEALYAKFV
jgi:two-component system, NtrC family, response regulator AtoC